MYIDMAKELITEYGALFMKVFHEALEAWHEIVIFDGVEHKKRTQSSFIWDAVIYKLRSDLVDDSNFYFVNRNGTTFVLYKQTFLIKIKKLGKNGRPSFIKTQQADKFQNQLDLGFGDYVNVYLNYSLDAFDIFIDNLKLQCENGNSILWSFPIDRYLDNVIPDLFFPSQEIPNNRIRIKNSKKQEQQDGKSI